MLRLSARRFGLPGARLFTTAPFSAPSTSTASSTVAAQVEFDQSEPPDSARDRFVGAQPAWWRTDFIRLTPFWQRRVVDLLLFRERHGHAEVLQPRREHADGEMMSMRARQLGDWVHRVVRCTFEAEKCCALLERIEAVGRLFVPGSSQKADGERKGRGEQDNKCGRRTKRFPKG